MKRVDIVFKRTGKFILRGAASVDIKEGENWRDKAQQLDFAEFLPLREDFSEDTWEFDTVYVEGDNDEQD